MTKHTQGKWEIMPRENLPPRIKSKSFGIICRLNDIFPTENGYQENEANARLIAAAPELLEFAENMSSYLKDIIADKNHPINWRIECEILLNNCNQAITKSKGE